MTIVVCAALVAACGSALGRPDTPPPDSVDPAEPAEPNDEAVTDAVEPSRPATRSHGVSGGRGVGRMSPGDARELLGRHGVDFEAIDPTTTPGVECPIRISGTVNGIEVHGPPSHRRGDILDCRVVVGLLVWSEVLNEAGVARIDSYSGYRPGARVARTGRPSGHSRGMAIDIGRFHLADGTVLDVEVAWTDRRRGVSPCEASEGDSEDQRLLRRLVCSVVEDETFQIVLTPHFDRAHRNHIHLELRPDVDWTYLR